MWNEVCYDSKIIRESKCCPIEFFLTKEFKRFFVFGHRKIIDRKGFAKEDSYKEGALTMILSISFFFKFSTKLDIKVVAQIEK